MQHSVTEPNADAFDWRFRCVALLQWLLTYFGHFILFLFNLICIPFKDFFASVQRASKRDNNNPTPGEGTCFELGKLVCLKVSYISRTETTN